MLDFIPRDPLVTALLDFADKQILKIALSVIVPAIVYFNGTVHVCREPAEFFRKDILVDWNDLIVGL